MPAACAVVDSLYGNGGRRRVIKRGRFPVTAARIPLPKHRRRRRRCERRAAPPAKPSLHLHARHRRNNKRYLRGFGGFF